MRRLFAVTLLAGCASSIIPVEPCSCVLPPEVNGVISLAIDDTAVLWDAAGGGAAETTAINGAFGTSEDGRSVVTYGIYVTGSDGIGFAADWPPGTGYGAGRPVPLRNLYFYTDTGADTPISDAINYELGPSGGTLRLRLITADAAGGYRVRGGFQAEACPETGGPCITLSGDFAFTVDGLPDAGDASSPTG